MVVSASAGSGKTYALALRTAQFLLSPLVPHASLPNIIAMTFTNAAAEEMRQRVVKFLKEAALGAEPESGHLHRLRSIVTGTSDETQDRARELVDMIFARYDEFQVRTIDSFIARAFKASALEAGLPPDFELVKLQLPLIEAAFDRYVRDAARRPGGADDLQRLVDLLDTSSHATAFDWNPFARIVSGSATLLRQIAARPADLDPENPMPAFEAALQRIRSTSAELKAAIGGSGLKPRKVVSDDLERLLSDDWRKALREPPREGALLKTNPATPAQRDAIERLFDRLNGERATLAAMDAASYYWPFVHALSVVADTIDATKRARGLYSIDDVNRLLWKSVAGGSAPAIYVTLGTRLYHFLIDEFQDTSPIQWSALKILIENACAEDGSLYAVGDTKQSIYSFRGADWQIMHRLLNGEETIDFQACLTASLDTNYRSDEAIIRFVEQVFQLTGAHPDFAEVTRLTGLDRCAQKTIEEKSGKGYVEVTRVVKTTEGRTEEDVIVDLVQNARTRNHSLGSIAILAQTNEQVLEIGGWLNKAGIHFLSYSNLDLRKRPIIMELISLMSWLDSPVDDLAFSAFVMGDLFARYAAKLSGSAAGTEDSAVRRFLADARRRKLRPLYTEFRSRFPALWESGLSQLLARVGYLPAYDVVCEIFKAFDVFSLAPSEQTALAGMLDAVKNLETKGAISLKELVQAAVADEGAEEDDVWSLSSQKKPDAVTVMTVHKAKGLQFPVLIVLLTDGRWPSTAMKLVEDEGKIRFLHVTKQNAAHHPALQDIYDRDLLLQRADALNRLYVALTRAQHELFVVLVEGEERKFPSSMIPDAGDPKTRPLETTLLQEPTTSPVLDPVMHTQRLPEEPAQQERIGFIETQRGDLLHRILSRIEFIKDDPESVVAGLLENDPGVQEHPEAGATLVAFLRSSGVAPLFAPKNDRTVMNEKEFLSRTGAVQRMDRVMVEEDEVTVIDFKTGGEQFHAAHREQIGRYLEILSDIYPGKVCRGILAYIDRRRTVVVEPESAGDTRL